MRSKQSQDRLYRGVFRGLIVAIGLLFVAGLSSFYLVSYSVHKPFELRSPYLRVAPGDTLRDFALKVEHIGGSQGVLPLLWWAYLTGQSGKLKTGNYDFGSHSTTAKILNKVVDGDVGELSAAIALRPIAHIEDATFVTNAGDDRIFVTTLGGQIYLSSGQPDTPWSVFLDIGELMCPADLEGIFSMAFHPQFPTVPYFYIFYVEANINVNGPKCKSVVSRYMVSPDNPNIADPASGVKQLSIDVEKSHHGGQVAFGPDGYLWISVGYSGNTGGGRPKMLFAAQGHTAWQIVAD